MGLTSSSSSSMEEMAKDSMVKNVEIEAAEALADLAYFAMKENGDCQKWRINGLTRNQEKTESTTIDIGDKDIDSFPRFLDLEHRIQDSVMVSQERLEGGRRNQLAEPSKSVWESTKKRVKAVKEVVSLKPSTTCTTNFPIFGCRRSRRNLTEVRLSNFFPHVLTLFLSGFLLQAEKEERRIRRVLANRESARQTIRRRQALCEELTIKAAGLAWENENLRREKELALKEYHSLETTNKKLKEQMAQAVKPKVEEIPSNDRSLHVQMPPLPTNYPLFFCSRPAFTPYFWPSVVPSSSPYQSVHERQNIVVIPSSIHSPASNSVSVSDSSHEQENFTNVNGPRTPYCVVPCSWFFPHHDHRNQINPKISVSMENNQEEVCLNAQNSAYSSKVVAQVETRHSSLPEEKKGIPNLNEASNSKNYNQDTAFGVLIEGSDTDERVQVRKMLSLARLECIAPTSTFKQDNRSEDDNSPCAFPERKQEREILGTKIIDSAAAAEARKRRKELTKLKNLHGRQCH